jgi:hypothetical protein
MNDVTRILSAISSGDPQAAEQLLPLVYDELRKLAADKMAQEKPGQTLDPTALGSFGPEDEVFGGDLGRMAGEPAATRAGRLHAALSRHALRVSRRGFERARYAAAVRRV